MMGDTLVASITDYIHLLQTNEIAKKLNVVTPMEYHDQYIKSSLKISRALKSADDTKIYYFFIV